VIIQRRRRQIGEASIITQALIKTGHNGEAVIEERTARKGVGDLRGGREIAAMMYCFKSGQQFG
jgi:hypothetical protein